MPQTGISDSTVFAFEGGATHTKSAIIANGETNSNATAGPCNPTAYGVLASVDALIAAGEKTLAFYHGPRPAVAAIGSAGAVDDAQRRALGEAVCTHFGLERVVVSTDLHPLLLANARDRAGVLAIAGTGSNVLARDAAGRMVQVGGRGTLLGDEGSGYMIAAEALRRAARAHDGWGPATRLTETLAQAAGVASFDAMVLWGANATKRDVAALSRVVLVCAAEGDAVAGACVSEQAALLAEQVLAAVAQLSAEGKQLDTVFGVGGLFETYPLFVEAFDTRLAKDSRLRYAAPKVTGPAAVAVLTQLSPVPSWAVEIHAGQIPLNPPLGKEEAGMALDALAPVEIVRQMLSEESRVSACLGAHEAAITTLVQMAADTIGGGGRILYFGAGTSGRLGVLDASECGPTFGVGTETITAHIAGGDSALRLAAEGAEDDAAVGANEINEEKVSSADLVIGIAASGSTPYVRGALESAQLRGAKTALISCVAKPSIPANLVLALGVGIEALPGSTRLKAGTASKVVLNIVSTGAMALNGRIFEGRMVAMRATNEKLRRRAEAMVAELGPVPESRARELLAATHYDIRTALLMARRNVDVAKARECLERHGGILREALGVAE